MKIHDLLFEKISLTSQLSPLRNKISKKLNDIVNNNYSYYQLPAEYKELQIDLREQFNTALVSIIALEVKSITGVVIKVKFLPVDSNIGGNYHYQSNTMMLSVAFVNELVKNHVLLLQSKLSNKATASTEKFFESNINQSVAKLSGIIIHETTHVIQLNKAGSDEYVSSYVEPNRDQVHLANMILHDPDYKKEYEDIIGHTLTDKEMQHFKNVYLSQPQEITAYAHQTVSDLIKHTSTQLSSAKKINMIKSELNKLKSNEITHPYSHMANSTDKHLQKTYQRFISDVYRELMSYIESIS
jgi:hypothetical protein